MRTLLLASLTFLIASASAADPEAPPTAPSLAPEALHALREQGKAPVVIDVRTQAEFEAGHIPGAVHIPFDEVAQRIATVDAPNGVALYCMVGPRARKGEARLLASGYASVFHLEGGLAAWRSAGLPVSEGP